ncbi:PKD domain-containing protein [Aquimarina sp. 2201CG1-2-11]|uniref:PKD domain-containing protein n=1 Tax=Aquimarina discodermiae TaxID=3231043 RepID=UPI003462DECA
MKKIIYILSSFLLLLGCAKEEAVPVVVDFEYEVFNEDYSIPVQIVFSNRTAGGDEYEWKFEGGVPSRSVNRNPGVVQFDTKGLYTIELFSTNQDGESDHKKIEIQIDDPVIIDFEVTNLVDTFSPASYQITNNSSGANSYKWTFEGGAPATSTQENPGEVSFEEPGEHTIRLEISNGRETYYSEKTITVAPFIVADFEYTVAFEDDDFQIPAKIQFTNTSISGTSYQWSFQGASTLVSTEEHPEVTFTQTGTKTISLIVSNGKETKTVSKQITFFANTNLRELNDIKLGINTANTAGIGSFYSIKDRLVYTHQEITSQNEPFIDIVFFGLNQNFGENFFTSPNDLSETTFRAFDTPKNTIFINSQELDNRPGFSPITVAQFDAMQNDVLLESKVIETTAPGSQAFDNTIVPRIVLFQTEEGKKGAIKIKEYVQKGQESYILVDIKVQKE